MISCMTVVIPWLSLIPPSLDVGEEFIVGFGLLLILQDDGSQHERHRGGGHHASGNLHVADGKADVVTKGESQEISAEVVIALAKAGF